MTWMNDHQKLINDSAFFSADIEEFFQWLSKDNFPLLSVTTLETLNPGRKQIDLKFGAWIEDN